MLLQAARCTSSRVAQSTTAVSRPNRRPQHLALRSALRLAANLRASQLLPAAKCDLVDTNEAGNAIFAYVPGDVAVVF